MTKWIQSLNNKDRESFLEFCKKTASPVQIYLFSRFLGFQGTIVECNEWSEKEFKKRNFNQVLETEIDNMREDIAKLRYGSCQDSNATKRITWSNKTNR